MGHKFLVCSQSGAEAGSCTGGHLLKQVIEESDCPGYTLGLRCECLISGRHITRRHAASICSRPLSQPEWGRFEGQFGTALNAGGGQG